MASANPNSLLSVVDWPAQGITVRVRVDNLIRYVNVTRELMQIPDLNLVQGDDPTVLKLDYPEGVKCLELYKAQGSEQLSLRPLDVELKGITGIFYGLQLDYESFENVVPWSGKFGGTSDRICTAEHPALKSYGELIIKISELPDNWPAPGNSPFAVRKNYESNTALEIRMHRAIVETGLGIAPLIYGLVTEQGRGVVGFIMERIEGARSFLELSKMEGYKMTGEDKQACRDALKKLHDSGFLHGDIHPGNVLRCPDGSVKLIDFQDTTKLMDSGDPMLAASQEDERMMSLESWM